MPTNLEPPDNRPGLPKCHTYHVVSLLFGVESPQHHYTQNRASWGAGPVRAVHSFAPQKKEALYLYKTSHLAPGVRLEKRFGSYRKSSFTFPQLPDSVAVEGPQLAVTR